MKKQEEKTTCCICGEEYNKAAMHERFTGRRTLYLCPACNRLGNKEIDGKRGNWLSSCKGKHIKEIYDKNK